MNSTHQITGLLEAWKRGDKAALDLLSRLAYDELRKIARGYMAREKRNDIFQPTALVNEAWLKLLNEKGDVDWGNRRHFYSIMAWRMRQILYDYAMRHPHQHTGLTDNDLSDEEFTNLAFLHEALDKFSHINSRAAQVVELRYFGGYTIEDVARILEVGPATVQRDWQFAKSWLWNRVTSAKQEAASNPRSH
jgi:RNA polymerase sigma factor (TIGR02999 family)